MKDMATLLIKYQESSLTVDIEYFKEALSKVDSQMKNLPATAQVRAHYMLCTCNCYVFFNYRLRKPPFSSVTLTWFFILIPALKK